MFRAKPLMWMAGQRLFKKKKPQTVMDWGKFGLGSSVEEFEDYAEIYKNNVMAVTLLVILWNFLCFNADIVIPASKCGTGH